MKLVGEKATMDVDTEGRLADTRSSIAELKSTTETLDARLTNVECKFSDPASAMKVGCI